MTRLLNDILLVSALEQTSFIIQPEEVWLAEMMERKAQVYELQATARKIEFAYTYRNLADLPGRVSIDRHRIEQVLDNLFENALRYTPAYRTISLICTYQQDVLSFALRDTGYGIAPKDLPHVLEKFYQGKPRPGNKVHTAGGLGLYICKLFIEKHGGTIAIQNSPGGGCEVTVCLPTTLTQRQS
ncbi:MAG TPA: HAMP domain-containing sensor histidine kinase [Ktedonobacteraceae bacterium]